MHSVSVATPSLDPMMYVPEALCLPIRDQLTGVKMGEAQWMDTAKSHGVTDFKPTLSADWVDEIAKLLSTCVEQGVIRSKKELNKWLKKLNDTKKANDVVNELSARLNALDAEVLVQIDKSLCEDFESVYEEELPTHFYLHDEYQCNVETENGDYALRNYDCTSVFFIPVDTYSEEVQTCLRAFITFVSQVGHIDNTFDWSGYLEIDETLYNVDADVLMNIYQGAEDLEGLLKSAKEHLTNKQYGEVVEFMESYYECDLADIFDGNTINENGQDEIFQELLFSFSKHVAIGKSSDVFNEKLDFEDAHLPSAIKTTCLDVLKNSKSLSKRDKKTIEALISLLEIAEKHYVKASHNFESFSDVTHMGYVQSILVSEEFYELGSKGASEHEDHVMQAGDYVDYTISINNDQCLHALKNILLSSYLTQYATMVLKDIRDEFVSDRERSA